ncbi:unnamed protein product [Porites lobata]|uniref:Uncharacterized protein n=1 Tax=Porites lobata TaxID=104759 RepID=A0ABN8QTV9_9CNID|nr:unnamed protein product [Porites lobata]
MGESEWEKEKPKLLKMIQEKQDQLNDFEKRFFPVTIDDEREALKEKNLLKHRDLLKSKIDTIKHEIEILQLKKKLKELEEENASLSLSSKNS